MITFIKYLVVTFIVSVAVDFFTYSTNPKNYTKSLYHFVVRAPLSMVPLGVMGFSICAIGLWMNYREVGTIEPRYVMAVSIVGIPSFISVIAPLPRLWDVIVDGDDIKIIKLFVFAKHFKFSDISYAKLTKGEIRLYKENRKRCIFMVDAMCNGRSNFIKRLRKGGIEIIDARAEADRKKLYEMPEDEDYEEE